MSRLWKCICLSILVCISDEFSHGEGNFQITSKTLRKRSLGIVSPCITPNDGNGYCMPIRECPKLLNQLENESARDFINQSKCGPTSDSNPTNPRVCCGKYDNYKHSVNKKPIPITCGYQNVTTQTRIVGGKEAQLGEFPWLARLIHENSQIGKTFGCTGFLISPKFILTAAHCLESENVQLLGPIVEVQLGEHNTDTEEDCNSQICSPKPQIIRVRKRIVHQNYSMSSTHLHNDIGIIYLQESVKLTQFVSPICLLEQYDFEPNEYWISGWGSTSSKTRHLNSEIKMKVSLPPFPHSNCTQKYNQINIQVTDTQLCAGGIRNRDSCIGDSGGPLMLLEGDRWFAAGVVSYGLGCGKEGWPGVYTNITSYINSIKEIVNFIAKGS